MKKALIVFLVSCAVFFALVFACGSAPKSKGPMGEWKLDTDEGAGGSSTISMAPGTLEGVPGNTFTGKITKKYQYGFVCAKLYPDQETLDQLKQAKAISFRFIGNSEKYIISIGTTDVKDNAWFEYVYETQMNTPKTVIVPIEYFMQPAWGKTIATSVNMNNVTFLQWMYNGDEGPFDFKVWDIRIHTGSIPTESQIAPKASVAMKAAASTQAQPVGGSFTDIVWNVVDNFEYADGYMVYCADPRIFNGNKIAKGDSYTLKFTCTASRDLESEMRIYLVDRAASNGHERLSVEAPLPGSKLKAGVPFSAEITFNATKGSTSARPNGNVICMETSGAGAKGTKGSGKLKAFTITFSQFDFKKN